MRLALILAVIAAPAIAQEPDWPPFDGALLDSCLENAAQSEQEGDIPDFESCVGVASGVCMDTQNGSTTIGMSHCLGAELDLWDKKLNDSYAVILEGAKSIDAELRELGSAAEAQEPLLAQMQRDWATFRDAACSYEASRWSGGSGAGPASISCALSLTAQQYLRLRNYEVQDG